MSYHLVKFPGSPPTVDIAHVKWITPSKNDVYWPPIKAGRALDKLLITSASPLPHWRVYGIDKIYYSTDDLEKAKRKLKLVEDTSDLQTEADEETYKPKRKVQKAQRFISSDEEPSEERFIRPPVLKKHFSKYVDNIQSVNDPLTQSELSPSSIYSSDKNLPIYSSDKNPPIYREHSSSIAAPAGDSRNEEIILNEIADLLPSSTPKHVKYTGYQETVISLLSTIKNQNEQIIGMMKGTSRSECKLDPEFHFPIKNEEEMKATELLLQNNEKYANLLKHIKSIGGRDLANKTSRAMKFAMLDTLAAQYNYYGKRSNKKAFSALQLGRCIVDAIICATPDITAKNVEDQIKTWLKHAPERIKKQILRN